MSTYNICFKQVFGGEICFVALGVCHFRLILPINFHLSRMKCHPWWCAKFIHEKLFEVCVLYVPGYTQQNIKTFIPIELTQKHCKLLKVIHAFVVHFIWYMLLTKRNKNWKKFNRNVIYVINTFLTLILHCKWCLCVFFACWTITSKGRVPS